jgi:hypothetical protein
MVCFDFSQHFSLSSSIIIVAIYSPLPLRLLSVLFLLLTLLIFPITEEFQLKDDVQKREYFLRICSHGELSDQVITTLFNFRLNEIANWTFSTFKKDILAFAEEKEVVFVFDDFLLNSQQDLLAFFLTWYVLMIAFFLFYFF